MSAAKPANPRHVQVALHHATILEQRKHVEAAVLDAILTLMDYPPTPHADARRPWPADAQHFRAAVVPFQPADYDALIEERNIAGRCGYALCPRPKRNAPSTARRQFVDTEHGVDIVDRSVLEVWCSDDCAKRALYVKVQLNEEPAWMRQGGYGDNIELMVDNADEQHRALPFRLRNEPATLPAGDAMGHLALERGEKPGLPPKATNSLVQDDIMERMPSNAPPQSPSLAAQPSEHTMAIEGHVPRIDRKEEEEEDDPQDWDKHLPT